MRQNERNKRTYLIIGLCAVLVIMVVGYAAFASNLTINTSSEISSNWNIEITNITPVIPTGSRATDNSSSCDESGTPKQCGDKLTASVSANLVSPGDSIMYRIEVTNKGSLNAVLSSINLVAGESNDIGYYINKDKTNTTISESGYRLLEEDGVLNASGDANNLDKGYVYLTIYYKEYEGQTSPTGANKTVSAAAKFNFVQTNNEASSQSGSVNSFIPMHYEDLSGDPLGCDTWDSRNKTTNDYCHYVNHVSAGDSLNGLNIVSSYNNLNGTFLGYDTDNNNNVSAQYVCVKLTLTSETYCFKGGNSSYYSDNLDILSSIKDNAFSGSGNCSTSQGNYSCQLEDEEYNYYEFTLGENGNVTVVVYDGQYACNIINGGSYCSYNS